MSQTRVDTRANRTSIAARPNYSSSSTPMVITAQPNYFGLQRMIGNRAIQRLLNVKTTSQIQRDPLPQADLGDRNGGRAHGLDWDSRHRAIDRITADQTLRQIYIQHLGEQLETYFGDELGGSYPGELAQERVEQLIQDARDAGDAARAQTLQQNYNIALQFAVVETLNVENSDRYEPVAGGPTYCNIYAYDIITALGGYLPRVWWNDSAITRLQAGETVTPVYGTTVHEVNANEMTRWMARWGADYGWQQAASMTAAQVEANRGQLVIILARNVVESSSGHVNIVMPETPGHAATRDADGNVTHPMMSQAGRNNEEYGANTSQWWQDANHTDGAAWIYTGTRDSDLIVSPENAVCEPETEADKAPVCEAE